MNTISPNPDFNPQLLRALEFPTLIDIVAGYAASPPGADAIRALTPTHDPDALRRRFKPVDELMALQTRGESPPLNGLQDLEPQWQRLASPVSILDPADWGLVRQFLALAKNIHRYFAERQNECADCAVQAAGLNPLPELVRELNSIIDDAGQVRDSASHELSRIRGQLHTARAQFSQRQDSLLRELGAAGALQESYWTLRKGRHVVPIKASHKGRAPGLVHDSSDSGETLFIEPLALVEASNRIAELVGREHEEIVRILRALADFARPSVEALRQNSIILAALDSAFGRARYGYRHALVIPRFETSGAFRIRAARHPLLIAAKGAEIVPIDLEFQPDQRVLILTGPNTGGKTTTIKTLGLLCLMAQTGVPVPAHAQSTFPLLRRMFADIGDDQSLASGLSTFSGHLIATRNILQSATKNSLVLLDELGTATDPVQGGALAIATLERLAQQGALVIATTHLPDLKRWAHDHPQARNAATRFDESSGQPVYQIAYDQPGASEAFRIARRLGFPEDILAAAEARIPKGERALNAIIQELEDRERQMAEEARLAKEIRRELEERLEYVRLQEEDLNERHRKHRQVVVEEQKRAASDARAQIEQRIAGLGSRGEIEAMRRTIQSQQLALEEESRQLAAAAPDSLAFDDLFVGMEVYLRDWRETGRIARLSVNRETATIDIKGAQIELEAHKLSRPEKPTLPTRAPAKKTPAKKTKSKPPSILSMQSLKSMHSASASSGADASDWAGNASAAQGRSPAPIPAALELNLHGLRVEPALAELERFIDRAILDGFEAVRILTGRGAIRDAVEQTLRQNTLVARFERGTAEFGQDASLYVRLG